MPCGPLQVPLAVGAVRIIGSWEARAVDRTPLAYVGTSTCCCVELQIRNGSRAICVYSNAFSLLGLSQLHYIIVKTRSSSKKTNGELGKTIFRLYVITVIGLPMKYFALKPLCVMLVSVRNLSVMEEPVECWVDGRVLPQSREIKSALDVEPSRSSK